MMNLITTDEYPAHQTEILEAYGRNRPSAVGLGRLE
jgi:hypothetical protein